MSGLLIALAIYIVIDRLLTIAWKGRWIEIDGAFVFVSLVTGTFFVIVLLKAAYGGVTP